MLHLVRGAVPRTHLPHDSFFFSFVFFSFFAGTPCPLIYFLGERNAQRRRSVPSASFALCVFRAGFLGEDSSNTPCSLCCFFLPPPPRSCKSLCFCTPLTATAEPAWLLRRQPRKQVYFIAVNLFFVVPPRKERNERERYRAARYYHQVARLMRARAGFYWFRWLLLRSCTHEHAKRDEYISPRHSRLLCSTRRCPRFCFPSKPDK